MRHNLKIDNQWLSPIIYGAKKAEVRYNDRDFQVGDELLLYLLDESQSVMVKVTHVLPLKSIPGCSNYENYVSLSFEILGVLDEIGTKQSLTIS